MKLCLNGGASFHDFRSVVGQLEGVVGVMEAEQ